MSNTEQEMSDNINQVNETYNNKNKKNIKPIWKSEQEDILKKWADKALCYKTMHDRATKKYWCLNAWFNIPVIILSTLTGTGNFAQGTFGPKYGPYLILAIGTANLLSAIMGTIAQYINVAGMLEGHRFASISWDKYARGVSVELGKVRSDRQDPASYLKRCQEDYDRLIEISPNFSNDIIEWFNKLIQTGEISDDNQFCGICCYEWFCLPCGFRGCKKFKICCSCCPTFLTGNLKEKEMKRKQFSSNWGDIELPEILGKFSPTKIVREEGNNFENKYRIENMDIDV